MSEGRAARAMIWRRIVAEVNGERLAQALIRVGMPDARLYVWQHIETVVTGDYETTVKKGS